MNDVLLIYPNAISTTILYIQSSLRQYHAFEHKHIFVPNVVELVSDRKSLALEIMTKYLTHFSFR